MDKAIEIKLSLKEQSGELSQQSLSKTVNPH